MTNPCRDRSRPRRRPKDLSLHGVYHADTLRHEVDGSDAGLAGPGTGHRFDRDHTGRFGDRAYAMEVLAAELGAAFLRAGLGFTPAPRADHACYIWRILRAAGSWTQHARLLGLPDGL